MSATQILVVEDERLVATALQNELEQFGYSVSGIAASAGEAIKKAVECKPDLVLMDIHLQGEGDGIEAARCIRDRWGIPVVYLSAFSDPETLDRASQTEAFGFLLKPYEERELHTTIEMAIAKRRAEQRLEETERWLAAIHNGIHDAVMAVDPADCIRFVNLASEALTGWKKEAAIGASLTAVCRLFDESSQIALDELTDQAVLESRAVPLPATARLISKHGRETPVEGSVSPIYDSRGEFLGTVLTIRDISARLELERVRRQSEERQRRAQKMEAVSHLAGGLSHDLTDLLTAILGNTSLALTQLPEEANSRELLERVEVAAQRAAELSQRLLLFSMFAGRPASKLRQVELGDFIPECLNEIELRLDSKIGINYRPGPGLWPVAADELLLGQAILELALNAEDAMPTGGVLTLQVENVTLTAADLANHAEGKIGQFVRLRVSDTGRGMVPSVSAQILEPFSAADQPAKAAGLGLALVTAAVAQHHGWLECQSQAGQGTQFDVYLPRHGMESSTEPTRTIADKPRGTTPTILLVDSDPLVREVGRRILEDQGYRVLLAEDGVEALAAYRQEPKRIDLAILDLNMPRLTAYAVLERLLEIDPEVRVLFSGGYFSEDLTASTGHTLGVITKPYRQSELVEMVRRALPRQVDSEKPAAAPRTPW